MSEQHAQYGQPAAIIEQPRKVLSLHEEGMREYNAWGWVKISAKFISHIKKLRGAKLAIWQCIALSIDETGTCNLTIKELKELTGYSHTEVIESLRELDEMGYLSVDKDGKRRIYTPEFAARGNGNDPSELVKKVDSSQTDESSGVYQYGSSPAPINSTPTFKELKEYLTEENLTLLKKAGLEWMLMLENVTSEQLEKALSEHVEKSDATKMFEKALGFTKPLPWWNGKDWTEFAEWVTARYGESPSCFGEYNIWRNEKYTKGGVTNVRIRGFVNEFYDSWDTFRMAKPLVKPHKQPVPETESWKKELNLG